ncbi:hypothetical protein [Mailhella sp.]|uniref:hypothetical protein n=1 Tax=Mailhella sp. TaxID=1981029 RepID=UPI003AB3727D
MYLGEKGQRTLRILHIMAASAWLGSVLCVLALVHAAPRCASDDELFGMLRASVVISQYVLVPAGAFGTFFTGLTYSLCTYRGFVRYPWVLCKWILAVGMTAFGVVWLGPWAGQELDDVRQYGAAAYERPAIAAMHARRERCYAAYAGLLTLSVALAVCRPGEKNASRQSPDRSAILLRK